MPAASCENCGSELPQGSRFCPECGARVGAGPGETAVEELPPARPARCRSSTRSPGRATSASSGRPRRSRRSGTRSARRPATPSSRSPSTRPRASTSTGCAASSATCWRSGPSLPVCSGRRCTLATRKGRQRPASGWRARRARQREGGRDGANSRKRDGAHPARAAPGAADPDRAAGPAPDRSAEPARRRSRCPCRSRRRSRPSRPGPHASPSRRRLRARRRAGVGPAGRTPAGTDEVTHDAPPATACRFLVVLLAVSATPANGDVAARKQAIDTRLQRVQAKSPGRAARAALAGQIAAVNGRDPHARVHRSASSRRRLRRSSATSSCTARARRS